MENCSSEVFVHISAARCWELVRERVNQEITRLHKLGRTNLPPLQPPGSLDGFEMFGFSSPAIVQVNKPDVYQYSKTVFLAQIGVFLFCDPTFLNF